MIVPLNELEGRRFCVVFVKILDPAKGRVQLQCLHGRANIDGGHLDVVHESGSVFTVPGSALPNILPSDGTKILRDAEYYVFVKVDEGIEFFSPN